MLSAHSRGGGRWHRPTLGAVARLRGLAVAIGVVFALAAVPSAAWAEPSTDSDVSTDTGVDTVDTRDAGADGADGTDTVDPEPNDAGRTTSPETAQAEAPTVAGSSETEVTIGGDGPTVTIRYSGGYSNDTGGAGDDDAGDDAAPLNDQRQPETGMTGESADAPAPTAYAVPVVTASVPERRSVPGTSSRVAELAANTGHVHPLGTGLDPGTGPAAVAEGFGSRTGATASTTVTPAPACGTSGSHATAAPLEPGGDLLDPPAGIVDAASNVLAGVFNVLFAPATDGVPIDSPVVWAVLGLVRRQVNEPSGESNSGPLQTSRTFGDVQAFTVLTDRYAYVLRRGSAAVTVVDVDTREVVDFPVDLQQLVGTPVVSPDGAKVFVTRAHNGGVYAIDAVFGETVDINAATATAEPIVSGGFAGPNDYYVPDGGLAFSADGGLLYVSRQHAQIVSGIFMPAEGDVVVVGNDPTDPATYLQVIGGPVDVDV